MHNAQLFSRYANSYVLRATSGLLLELFPPSFFSSSPSHSRTSIYIIVFKLLWKFMNIAAFSEPKARICWCICMCERMNSRQAFFPLLLSCPSTSRMCILFFAPLYLSSNKSAAEQSFCVDGQVNDNNSTSNNNNSKLPPKTPYMLCVFVDVVLKYFWWNIWYSIYLRTEKTSNVNENVMRGHWELEIVASVFISLLCLVAIFIFRHRDRWKNINRIIATWKWWKRLSLNLQNEHSYSQRKIQATTTPEN